MIFRGCKCQNINFSQTEPPNLEELLRYQKVMGCYNFWIYCASSNGGTFKPNFVLFGV
jgi:hypothetical protein